MKKALLALGFVLAFVAGAYAQKFGGISYTVVRDTMFLGTRWIVVCDKETTDRYIVIQGFGPMVVPHGCETDAQLRVRLRREAEAAR